MASTRHDAIVLIGAKWLKKQGCGVVATELQSVRSREQPDVIGFRSTCSIVIEVKVSRSDFLADGKKPERRKERPGVGVYRFYLSPPDIIKIEDLPKGWGLLHEVDGKIKEIVRPLGNIWPRFGDSEWSEWQHECDADAEKGILYSIARRLSSGSVLGKFK